MKEKLLHPELKTVIIGVYIYATLLSVSSFLLIPLKEFSLTAFRIVSITLLIVFILSFALLLYSLIDCLKRAILEFRKKSSSEKAGLVKGAVKERKTVSSIFSSLFGILANFLMSALYLIYAATRGSYFYAMVALLYLLSFVARVHLLSYGLETEKKEQAKALRDSSIFSFLFAVVATVISIYVYVGAGSFEKNVFLLVIVSIFTFIKVLSAVHGFRKKRKKQATLLLSYAQIALVLALFSLFVLQVEIIVAYSGLDSLTRYAWTGFIIDSAVFIVAAIGLFEAIKIIRAEKQNSEPEDQENA